MSDPVGDRLRRLTDPPPAPDPVGAVLARSARSRRRRSIALGVTAVIATVGVVGAVQLVVPQPAPTANGSAVVPWEYRLAPAPPVVRAVPGPDGWTGSTWTGSTWTGSTWTGSTWTGSTSTSPRRQPSAVPTPTAVECRAEDLSASAEEPRTPDGSRGGVVVDVVVRNEGPACTLPDSSPPVLLGDDGTAERSDGGQWLGARWGPSSVLQEGGTATSTFSWAFWCRGAIGRWGLELRAGGRLPVRILGDRRPVPPCQDLGSDQTAVFGSSSWTVLDDVALGTRRPLAPELDAPEGVRLGEVLHMTLRLRNASDRAVPLDPCPSFSFSVAETEDAYHRAGPDLALNCPAAPDDVPARGSLEFRLELPLDASLADGRLAPGRWWVGVRFAGTLTSVGVEVLPPAGPPTGSETCTYAAVPGAVPRVPGLPDPTAPRTPPTEPLVLEFARGAVAVELDRAASPCAVQAFLHLVDGGFWTGQRCNQQVLTSLAVLSCGEEHGAVRSGFLLPTRASAGTRYPRGTLVLDRSRHASSPGRFRLLLGDGPVEPVWTVLGRVTGPWSTQPLGDLRRVRRS